MRARSAGGCRPVFWAQAPPGAPKPVPSIAVVRRLVGPVDRNAEVLGLLLVQAGQLDADPLQVQARNLLVEVLRQPGDPRLAGVPVFPEVKLGGNLARD